jgi:hypothetical protein
LPHTVRVSASERQSGSLTDQNLEVNLPKKIYVRQ